MRGRGRGSARTGATSRTLNDGVRDALSGGIRDGNRRCTATAAVAAAGICDRLHDGSPEAIGETTNRRREGALQSCLPVGIFAADLESRKHNTSFVSKNNPFRRR